LLGFFAYVHIVATYRKDFIVFRVTENLHLFSDDLYRMGNSGSPRINHVRPVDIKTVEMNGILQVLPRSGGISLMDSAGLESNKMKGWIWKIKKGTTLPAGLKLVHDKIGHYSLEPAHQMPKTKFILLLEELVIHCERYMKR